MKRSIFIICVFALFTCDSSAAIKQGDYDYDFNFRWSSESGANGVGDRDVFEIGLGVAKQVTRRIQLGIAVGHARREVGPIEDRVNYLDLKVRYHIFPDRLYVPYVGGLYRWFDRDRSGDPAHTGSDTATGLLLGLRREITKHNDIYLEFQHLNYGNNWPIDVSSGNKVLIGFIHRIR